MLKAAQLEEERARQLDLARKKAAVSPLPGGEPSLTSLASSASVGSIEASLMSIAAEAQRLAAELEVLPGGGAQDPVWLRAQAALAGCGLPASG